jgi:hypothetical protein
MSAVLAHDRISHDLSRWHDAFLADVLPAVHTIARFRFRNLRPVDREEAVAETTATAMIAFVRLIKRGKDPMAFVRRLAHFSAVRVLAGRLASSPDNVRDVLSRYAKQRLGFKVESLNQRSWDRKQGWRELLVEDRRACPAEIAQIRLDFELWLSRMTVRRRRIAECLAQGHRTRDVARRFRVSPARISQIREEFRRSWEAFDADSREGR